MRCRNCKAVIESEMGFCEDCVEIKKKIRVYMGPLMTEIVMTGLACYEAARRLQTYAESIGWNLMNVDHVADSFARWSDTQGDY